VKFTEQAQVLEVAKAFGMGVHAPVILKERLEPVVR
jgi:hypothetical protein